MATMIKIDDEEIDADSFLRVLKLGGQFESLVEQFVKEKITVLSAQKHGIRIPPEEIQARADQFRRVRGLHRASDMNHYLDTLGVSLDEFEAFISAALYEEKMMATVCSAQAVEAYFQLNSPRFDSIEVSHIIVDTEGKAKEMISVLRDDPESFPEMAREYSVAETREQGGLVGKVLRGSLKTDIEAKVFNAAEGDLLGPFPSADQSFYEIFTVNAKYPARLDEDVAREIRRLLREEWLLARAQEHLIEVR